MVKFVGNDNYASGYRHYHVECMLYELIENSAFVFQNLDCAHDGRWKNG